MESDDGRQRARHLRLLQALRRHGHCGRRGCGSSEGRLCGRVSCFLRPAHHCADIVESLRNIGSNASVMGLPNSSAYVSRSRYSSNLLSKLALSSQCASKHAVLGMSRAMAKEYAQRDIRVNVVAPGSSISLSSDARGLPSFDSQALSTRLCYTTSSTHRTCRSTTLSSKSRCTASGSPKKSPKRSHSFFPATPATSRCAPEFLIALEEGMLTSSESI